MISNKTVDSTRFWKNMWQKQTRSQRTSAPLPLVFLYVMLIADTMPPRQRNCQIYKTQKVTHEDYSDVCVKSSSWERCKSKIESACVCVRMLVRTLLSIILLSIESILCRICDTKNVIGVEKITRLPTN